MPRGILLYSQMPYMSNFGQIDVRCYRGTRKAAHFPTLFCAERRNSATTSHSRGTVWHATGRQVKAIRSLLYLAARGFATELICESIAGHVSVFPRSPVVCALSTLHARERVHSVWIIEPLILLLRARECLNFLPRNERIPARECFVHRLLSRRPSPLSSHGRVSAKRALSANVFLRTYEVVSLSVFCKGRERGGADSHTREHTAVQASRCRCR